MPRNVEPRPAASIPVEATRHTGDHRVNIPTAELESFAGRGRGRAEGQCATRATRRLDPQLVWKGKDEQDATDLAVPVVPDLHPGDRSTRRRSSRTCAPTTAARREPQLDLFSRLQRAAVRGAGRLLPAPGKWSNRMILGDSLLVMTSLAEKEGLKGQVQMIYIDPPYGIKFGSQLAGQHPQARRQGRQGRGRHPPARAGPGLPRHLGARHPLVPRATCATGSPSPASC